jgi:hypothetical protein
LLPSASSVGIRERDVQIEILYCGVCHSDLHTVRGEWGGTLYPSLPGHEIVGRVTRVGSDVQKFKANNLVGVGCMVDSCRTCRSCREGLEQYCEVGFTGTYNGPEQGTGANTYGGYSNTIVVDESFVLLEVSVAVPAFRSGERLPGPELVVVDLDHLLPRRADPAPTADQAHNAEEVALDHEAVEPRDPLLRVDPVQHQVVLDR